MLSCLSAPFETGLKLTLASRDDEYGDICLGGAGDHGRDIGFVTGSIEDGVATCGGLKVSATDFDGLALAALLWGGVEGPAEIPRFFSGLLCVVFVLFHGSFVDDAGDVEQVTAEGALSGVYVTDEYDVQMFLCWGDMGDQKRGKE